MDNNDIYRAESLTEERMTLAVERIGEIPEENREPGPFHDFFLRTAEFLNRVLELRGAVNNGTFRTLPLAEMKAVQEEIWRDYLPENYETSWLNPVFSVKCAEKALCPENAETPAGERAEETGRLLSALYAELFSVLRYIFEQRDADVVPMLELYLQVYGLFGREELPAASEIRDAMYWHAFDYLDVTVPERTEELLLPAADVAGALYHGFPEADLRYLFLSGDYISESTLKTAEFLNSLPEEKLEAAARAFTEGYIEGFRVMGRDLKKKETAAIRYTRGFERLVKREAELFAEAGLKTILPGSPVRAADRIPGRTDRQLAFSPNRQADYDHRFDSAVFWDKAFTDRKTAELKSAYEKRKKEASLYAGPAVMEYFGETEFEPENHGEAFSFSPKQRKLLNGYMAELSEIQDSFMPGDETSFTIIAWPLPEIGSFFPELFDDILRINTLDNTFYRNAQQKIIDLLDRCDHAEVRGAAGNDTALKIALRTLSDPEKETRFENCVSDVNIPAGEVFTSPVLAGTEGLLHVKEVFIDGLLFKDLRIRFVRGRAEEYSCGNFTDAEQNRRFVLENILGNHEVLPMGEFAIGTNTLASVTAKKYGIGSRMPILIAEKTGPHFALGDTCYSHEEDTMTYNPDGKAIIARDNEISEKRHEDPAGSYFSHHKDITIPYDEIGSLSAVMPDGSRTDIIRDGRFVLPGLEELNRPLESEARM